MMNKRTNILILLLVVAHLVMLIPAIRAPERFQRLDSEQYIALARALLQNGRYGIPGERDHELFRPPLYPMMVAFSILVGNGNLAWVSILQTLIFFGSAYLTYSAGGDLGGRKAGSLALILYLLNPNAAFWKLMVLSETFAAFLLAFSFWWLVRFWRHPWRRGKYWQVFLSGIFLGLSALARPIALPLLALWIVVILIESGVYASRRQMILALQVGLVCALGFFILVLPWQLRNYRLHGMFTLSISGDFTIYRWNIARVLARAENMPLEEAQVYMGEVVDPLQTSVQIIQRYPVVFAKEQVRGILRTCFGAEFGSWAYSLSSHQVPTTNIVSTLIEPAGERLNIENLLREPWFWAGIYALVYDLVIFGLICRSVLWAVKLKERTFASAILLLALSMGYLILFPAANGDSRFRVPADPFLGVMAGLAITEGKSG
jgi:4-amino-4-deoxy-L-arabinose transferase-like glycosyltransferase